MGPIGFSTGPTGWGEGLVAGWKGKEKLDMRSLREHTESTVHWRRAEGAGSDWWGADGGG